MSPQAKFFIMEYFTRIEKTSWHVAFPPRGTQTPPPIPPHLVIFMAIVMWKEINPEDSNPEGFIPASEILSLIWEMFPYFTDSVATRRLLLASHRCFHLNGFNLSFSLSESECFELCQELSMAIRFMSWSCHPWLNGVLKMYRKWNLYPFKSDRVTLSLWISLAYFKYQRSGLAFGFRNMAEFVCKIAPKYQVCSKKKIPI